MKYMFLSLILCSILSTLKANDPIIPADGPWVVRAFFTDTIEGGRYASRLAAWEMNYEEKYFVVAADEALLLELSHAGFSIELDEKKTAAFHEPREMPRTQRSGIPSYPCYRTVEETYTTALALVTQYPTLAEWIDIGDTWDKVQGSSGYDLMVLKITNQSLTHAKPVLFVMTSVHAREYTPAELNTRFAEYLLQGYGTDPDVTWIVDNREIHLVLQANPDGRKQAEAGALWRKNTNNDLCTSGDYGIDLNRNFPFHWGCCNGSSGNSCDQTYRGTISESEPETQSITAYLQTILEDQRGPNLTDAAPEDAHGLFLDIHSYSELVLWGWGFDTDPCPNGDGTQSLGRKLAFFNGYEPSQASTGLYLTDGTTIDHAYGEFGVASYVVELGTSFFQDCDTFENQILPDNLAMLIYAAKACEAPYMLGKGPECLDMSFVQNGATGGTLSLQATDQQVNQTNGTEPIQNISQVLASVDEFPQNSQNPVWLSASDGLFNSPVEWAEGLISTSSLTAQEHTLFVQSKDSLGNWGVVSAMNFQVPMPNTVIEGYVRDMGSLQGIGCAVLSGGFRTLSDPQTGYYQLYVTEGSGAVEVICSDHVGEEKVYSILEGQTLTRDFFVIPYCNALSQDAENGLNGWLTEGSWAISNETAHGGINTITDSPNSDYGNNSNTSLTSPAFDMTSMAGSKLSFWHRYDLESGYDFGYLEYRIGSAAWQPLSTFNGTSSGFAQNEWLFFEKIIPDWDGQAEMHIRFRLETDGSVLRDGWFIDDILVQGAGDPCVTVLTLGDFIESWPAPFNVQNISVFINIHTP